MITGGVRTRAVALLAALLATVACTGDDADPAPTTVAVEAPASLRLALGGPLAVDPAAVNPGSPAELMVADLLHDGLTEVAADGSLQPGLATDWAHDVDARTWTFTLGDDATFSDGRPVTAEDVVASLTRVAAAGPGSLASLRLELVAGHAELVAGEADALAGVRAVDDRTVEIETVTPLGTLPLVLAAPEMGIVAADALESLDPGAPPSPDLPLSGRWAIAEADDEVVALTPRDDDVALAGVELRVHEDEVAAYEAFDAGAADWALVPPERHHEAVEAHGDEHFAPFHAEVFLGLRVAGPLAEARLRQAVAAALDRDDIARDVYGDVADPLPALVPAGVPGHDPEVCGDAPGCRHDPEAAVALLDEAFPDGDVPTVTIDFDDTPRQRALADAVTEALQAVGIPVEQRAHEPDEYRSFVTSGDQQLFSFGWIGGYASPDAYLAPLLPSGADDNLTAFADPTVDLGLAAARATDDPDAAAEAWHDVERRALRAAVVVPVAQFQVQAVVADRVEGLVHRVDGTVDWAAVRVADGA